MKFPERIIAVVCAYWPSRIGNLRTIVDDLQSGEVRPDRILVLNNNPALTLDLPGADVVTSQFNSRTRGKFAVALLDPAEYYLLLDDDTSVHPRTLARFREAAHPDCCWGYCGVAHATGNGVRTYPAGIEVETPCQFFLGCGLFMSFRSVVRMFAAEEKVRLRLPDHGEEAWRHCGEDILVGLPNPSSILPMRGDELFKDLGWGTEAMAWGHDRMSAGGVDYLHYRDRFTEHAIKALA